MTLERPSSKQGRAAKLDVVSRNEAVISSENTLLNFFFLIHEKRTTQQVVS